MSAPQTAAVDGAPAAASTRLDPRITSVRRHAARGAIINSAFQIGMAGLLLVRRVVVAVFLTASEFGVWGALLTTLLLVVFIKNVGTADKYVQQDEPDQEKAFQKAFTIDLLLGLLAMALSAIAVPLFALAYGKPEIIVPGLVLSLAIVGNSLQAPVWIFYRRMDFIRQRSLQAVDPVVAFVVTVGLAVAGAGYWSLVIGGVVGAFTGGFAAMAVSPYRLALRLERGTIGEYFHFSWPLVVASGGGMLIAQVVILIATRTLGLAEVGAIGLAWSIIGFTDGVDAIVTQTLYPAICAVRDRTALVFETFIKSNRLALMWGMPFGFGLALFAQDIVDYGLGESWQPAVVLLQAFGVAAALNQLGFNWTAFLRAMNWTKPLAIMAVLNVVAFAVITAPLLIVFGLPGLAVGTLAVQLVTLAGRTYYLTQMFEGFGLLRHAARAMVPVLPAVSCVLLARVLYWGDRTLGVAIAELVLFAVVTCAATAYFERDLLREIVGYLRRRQAAAAVAS